MYDCIKMILNLTYIGKINFWSQSYGSLNNPFVHSIMIVD